MESIEQSSSSEIRVSTSYCVKLSIFEQKMCFTPAMPDASHEDYNIDDLGE